MSEALIGQLLALASATFYACSVAFISRSRVRGGDRGVMFSVLVTIALSGALWLVVEGPEIGDAGSAGWWAGMGWFALAGICAMVLGRSFRYVSIRVLGVTRSSATMRLNPFFSVALAAAFLGEVVTGYAALGMAAIAFAFWLMVRRRGSVAPGAPGLLDYSWGVAAALAYAISYIFRKIGMEAIPAPAFGTFVSAVAGFAGFLALAIVWPPQRANLAGMFRHLDRWLVLAAVLVSAGQIALFAALRYERVSVVVMISSLELFMASFLSVVIFRTEIRPDARTYLAAVIAVAGVWLIAAT